MTDLDAAENTEASSPLYRQPEVRWQALRGGSPKRWESNRGMRAALDSKLDTMAFTPTATGTSGRAAAAAAALNPPLGLAGALKPSGSSSSRAHLLLQAPGHTSVS